MSDKTVLIVACDPRDDLIVRVYLEILEDEGIAVPGAGIIQVNYLKLSGGGAVPDIVDQILEQHSEGDFIVLVGHQLCSAIDEPVLPRLLANAAELVQEGFEVAVIWIDELEGTVVSMKPELVLVPQVVQPILFSLN